MMYLLDTNICIYSIKKFPPQVAVKFESIDSQLIKISSVVVAELEYGAVKSQFPEKNKMIIEQFISAFDIIPFDESDAKIFGTIRADLEARGEIIGPYDMMLAAQAISRDLIFVTNNVREFRRIRALKLENWIGDDV